MLLFLNYLRVITFKQTDIKMRGLMHIINPRSWKLPSQYNDAINPRL